MNRALTWVRTHRVAAIAGVLAILVGTPVAAWLAVADNAASKVSVSWTPDCGPGGLSTFEGHTAITFRKSTTCTLHLDIANESGHSVHVTGVEAPFLGSRSGAEMVGQSLPGAKVRDFGPDARTSGERDAIYDVDLEVPPHGDRTVNLAIAWRPGGCSGATSTFSDWPAVDFDTLHRHFTRPAAQNLVLSSDPTGKPAPGCKDLGSS